MDKKIPPSTRASIEDVARLAGVSIATVSRVINKVPTVKQSNRKKVLAAIQSLHFSPMASAQRLASGKTNVISLVIPRYEGIFYSFYELELLRGIGTLCDGLKIDLLLSLTDTREPLNLSGVGGVVFADIIGNRHQLEAALELGVPAVVINNQIKDLDVSYIGIDNFKGAEIAVNYLISLGHKRIAHITGDLVTQAASQRLEGYKSALKKKGCKIVPEYIIKTDYTRGQSRQAAEKLLKLKQPPTAVFVASDSMALEVMVVIAEKGLKVPDDYSVIGFDDNPSGLYGAVALTTVKQPLVKMAQEGVKHLNLLMSGKTKAIKRQVLQPELIVRESCSRPKPSSK